eukprot:1157206-Pelagomonas_calceolata.AAC.7
MCPALCLKQHRTGVFGHWMGLGASLTAQKSGFSKHGSMTTCMATCAGAKHMQGHEDMHRKHECMCTRA